MFITVLMLPSPTLAEVTFTDVTDAVGLGNLQPNPTGAAGGTWGDYDNDGDVDLFLFRAGSGKKLFRNEGKGGGKFEHITQFTDVTQSAGLYLKLDKRIEGGTTAIFLDFDNDGDLDLFIGGNGSQSGDVLYQNNGDGTFKNTSKIAGMASQPRGYFGAISFDYDNDGLLDIYIATGLNLPTDFLYRNQGNGRFLMVDPAKAGVIDGPQGSDGIVLGDYDNDGDLDLYITTVRDKLPKGKNGLLRNEGNGKYVNVSEQAGVDRRSFDKNGVFWDYNNDGNLDLLIYSWPSMVRGKTTILYKNNGNGTFTDVTQAVGIELVNKDSSGANVGDYDNDGWLDLCITYHNTSTLFYHNNKNGTFTEISNVAGIVSTNSGSTSFVDYDNDGDLDLFTGQSPLGGKGLRLHRNNGTNNFWLELLLVGTKSNRDAIGARVTVTAEHLYQIREMTRDSGGWFGNKQDRIPLHFGLGSVRKADEIEVRWPSGLVEVFRDVEANQRILIEEGSGDSYHVINIEPRKKLATTFGHIKRTALLQNYPNPFNPETWIPFVLDEAAEVEIGIYEATGNQVRRLRLGRKNAGEYRTRGKAAYWDGRNDAGETMGSGIYLYEMRVGSYSSVRKAMLLK